MHPDTRRIIFVTGTMVLLLLLNIISAMKGLGWKSITFTTALILGLDVLYVIRYRDAQIGRWLLLGLAAGGVELLADWWLVRTGTLIYPTGEPMVWVSPAYMPFAWTMVLVQLGGVGMWLHSRMALLPASLLAAVVSGINIPLYEHLAKDAHWWVYEQTPMLFNAPYYVILAEFLLALPLVWMGRVASRQPPAWSLALGVAEGLWMFPVVLVAFWLLGPCSGAMIALPCP